MNEREIIEMNIKELKSEILKKKLVVKEVIQTHLNGIDRVNPKINAYISIFKEQALEQARHIGRSIRNGENLGNLSLLDVPVGLKDISHVGSTSTTYACEVFLDDYANCDATVVTKLRQSDAVILGKLDLHGIVFGTTNEESFFGPARNP